ncbi:unnamed protein product, partial [Phaeothamnion confervicola]
MWNLALLLIHFVLAGCEDIRIYCGRSMLKAACISQHLAFVSTAIMAGTYWPLVLYDRTLIMQASVHFPWRLDLLLHAWPAAAIVADAAMSRRGAGPFAPLLSLIVAYGLTYIGAQMVYFKVRGYFPYPFTTALSASQYVGFVVGMLLVAVTLLS